MSGVLRTPFGCLFSSIATQSCLASCLVWVCAIRESRDLPPSTCGDDSAIWTTRTCRFWGPPFHNPAQLPPQYLFFWKMSTNMFYGNFCPTENPLTFLTQLEESLASWTCLLDLKKCKYIYLICQSGFDAEAWYENLAPSITTSWSTLVLHFHLKWLQALPDLLLKMPSVPLDTATSIVAKPSITHIANANAATIPAYTTVPTPTIFETPAPLELPIQTVDIWNVMTVELASAPTTATMTPCECIMHKHEDERCTRSSLDSDTVGLDVARGKTQTVAVISKTMTKCGPNDP